MLINRVLLLFAVLAEALDALTIDWATERNPVALFLGPWAYVGKAGIILLMVWLALNVKDIRTTLVLIWALTISALGVWSNIGL